MLSPLGCCLQTFSTSYLLCIDTNNSLSPVHVINVGTNHLLEYGQPTSDDVDIFKAK